MSTSAKKIDKQKLFLISGALLVMSLIGLAMLAAIGWIVLYLNRYYRTLVGEWFGRCVLVGLLAAALLQHRLSAVLNLPAGWVAVALTGAGIVVGLSRRR
jgi:hypothetical protein